MDWPGAQELAKRFKKTIAPQILADDDDPALAAATQQMQQMSQQMQQMQQMLQNVQNSMENRELEIKEYEAQVKAYSAETQRLSTVAEQMTPDQIQEIVMGTIAAAVDAGDLIAGSPQMPQQDHTPATTTTSRSTI